MKRSPCRECPFKKESLPGYLGAASGNPREFLTPHWVFEVRLPCHLTVDWEDNDWQEVSQKAPLCQGLLIMMKNAGKLPRNPEIANTVRETDANREDVFSFPHEFEKHHE